jgi:P4 family phage/plasmid primase-like protien
VRKELCEKFGEVVYSEANFWRYGKTHWEPIDASDVRRVVHTFDGVPYQIGEDKYATVRLGSARIDSILRELSVMLNEKAFFKEPAIGINCASGFIRVGKDGQARLFPHDPKLLQRHTLSGHWQEGVPASLPEGSLLRTLLYGAFYGDDDVQEKIDLLSEVIGIAALGSATRIAQPRAIILKGETAENGKSQILDLARSLLPEEAVASVTAASVGDERHIIGLVGKLLNASDELSSSKAIASDRFKAVVTGEPIEGRDVYASRIEFRCVAQHMFSTNTLPVFQGGMDRGVQRRLLVIPFNRMIPDEKCIEKIGLRIGQEEADLLRAWVVDGARRNMHNRRFSIPKSSKEALREWLYGSDPVLAWAAERVRVKPITECPIRMLTRDAYSMFRAWAIEEGFGDRSLPSISSFTQRIKANVKGVEFRRLAHGRYFYGMEVVLPSQAGDAW